MNDRCSECGAPREADSDGFIKLRKPAGIPSEHMPALVARLYAYLLAAAEASALAVVKEDHNGRP